MNNVARSLAITLGITWASTAWAGTDVELEAVPAPVRATIERETQGATLLDLEWEPNARVPHYEIEYSRDGSEWELEVLEDGSVLRHERD